MQLNDTIKFGDLTVAVGTGLQSGNTFFQAFKLQTDQTSIRRLFAENNIDYGNNENAFWESYFGKGVISNFEGLKGSGESKNERIFYIPSHRSFALFRGETHHFGAYRHGDPYVLRSFSDAIHNLLQNELGASQVLFPLDGYLNSFKKPFRKTFYMEQNWSSIKETW